MQEIEIGSLSVCVALVVATLMIVFGWMGLPSKVRYTAVSCILMFVGYQILEFIATTFIVISK